MQCGIWKQIFQNIYPHYECFWKGPLAHSRYPSRIMQVITGQRASFLSAWSFEVLRCVQTNECPISPFVRLTWGVTETLSKGLFVEAVYHSPKSPLVSLKVTPSFSVIKGDRGRCSHCLLACPVWGCTVCGSPLSPDCCLYQVAS